MTRFYDIDAANAAVSELDGIVGVLAEQRAELVRLRDEVLASGVGTGDGASTALALTLRDIEHGLVDFPALVSGRQVWLCWQRGEKSIGWWHGLDTGFSDRR